MNSIIEEIYKTGRVQDDAGKLINAFPHSTRYEIGTFLYNLIQEEKLEKTLEIGMAYGLSTLFICQAHHDREIGHHIAVDPFQSKAWKSIGLLNSKRAGLDNRLRFFESYSYEILPKLVEKGEQLDFAFIDGSHLFDDAFIDFFYIDKILNVGGFIAFDDIWMPALKQLVNFVLKNKPYELFTISTTVPLSPLKRSAKILRHLLQGRLKDPLDPIHAAAQVCTLKKISDDNRPWDFHRSF